MLLPFAQASLAISLVALCGPAAAAFVTAAWMDPTARGAFLGRLAHWRVSAGWYVAALTLPLPISLVASLIERWTGAAGAIEFVPLTGLSAVVFVLVAGEEIGWRGLALPELRRRFSPLAASVNLGIIWALWHLPLFFMEGMPQFGTPFPAFVAYTIALSIILTWLADRTQGSVVIATLFHGAVNTFIVINTAAGPVERGWGNAAAFGAAAALVAVVTRRRR